jgi:hypothetical protein
LQPERGACTEGKPAGMVTIHRTELMGSQVLMATRPTDAVHRLNGGRSLLGLKI